MLTYVPGKGAGEVRYSFMKREIKSAIAFTQRMNTSKTSFTLKCSTAIIIQALNKARGTSHPERVLISAATHTHNLKKQKLQLPKI